MTKSFLIICFLLIAWGQTKAQLRMTKAEARETLSSMAFTVEKNIIRKGNYEFVHYINTSRSMETILRINKEGTCDQLITVLPMDKWDQYVKVFNGEVFPGPIENKPLGKNTWVKEDGTTTTMIPHKNNKNFSIVIAIPEGKS